MVDRRRACSGLQWLLAPLWDAAGLGPAAPAPKNPESPAAPPKKTFVNATQYVDFLDLTGGSLSWRCSHLRAEADVRVRLLCLWDGGEGGGEIPGEARLFIFSGGGGSSVRAMSLARAVAKQEVFWLSRGDRLEVGMLEGGDHVPLLRCTLTAVLPHLANRIAAPAAT